MFINMDNLLNTCSFERKWSEFDIYLNSRNIHKSYLPIYIYFLSIFWLFNNLNVSLWQFFPAAVHDWLLQQF